MREAMSPLTKGVQPCHEYEVHTSFKSIDQDGKGFVLKKDLSVHLSSESSLDISEKDVSALFKAIDINVSTALPAVSGA